MRGGGGTTPLHHSLHPHYPHPAAHKQPKTKPLWLGFGFLAPLPSHCQTWGCTIATTSSTPHHHLPLSPTTAVLHGAPEIKPSHSVSWLLFPSSLSHLTSANAQLHHHPNTTSGQEGGQAYTQQWQHQLTFISMLSISFVFFNNNNNKIIINLIYKLL